ncbi:MAG: hypothetical protein PHP25_02630 [Candidatus Moranbacteria bacterium]|nr:hypothetical protein [Candidatus Moranbacteria bacterium]
MPDSLLLIGGIVLAFLLVAACSGRMSVSDKSFSYYSRSPKRCQRLAKKIGRAVIACGIDPQLIETIAKIINQEHEDLLHRRDFESSSSLMERLGRYRYAINALKRISQGNLKITPWEAHALDMLGAGSQGGLQSLWTRFSVCPIDYRFVGRVEPHHDSLWFILWVEKIRSGNEQYRQRSVR